jgi:hypothetical protein
MKTLRRIITSWFDDESGNVFMFYAGALIPLLLMIGGAVDIANYYSARAKLQNACDAAVLAGRQSMEGNAWTSAVEVEADKFFDFNFPAGTNHATGLDFDIEQNADDHAELLGEASAIIPTIVMHMFGFETMDVAVNCNAKRDLGHNDVLLVLDTTGSMAYAPSIGGASKISRLRTGAAGIFRALDDSENGSVTRFGIVSYSHTVNVGRSLAANDILDSQQYVSRYQSCNSQGKNCKWVYGTKTVLVKNSSWGKSSWSLTQNKDAFRTSGSGCIEERPSVGNAFSPIEIDDTVSRADIDNRSAASADNALQFGRYDPAVQEGESQDGCPGESVRLKTYASETAFKNAVNSATANVTGGTYHDVGILWGARFLSSTGFFSADNPTEIDGVPVNKHIVFMTDGELDTGSTLYSAHGVETYQDRTKGTGSQNTQHINRFWAACSVAKSMGMTIWVVALDVTETEDVADCATSPGHFYTSDGSDLEEIFEDIGQGIGNLRLTR